MGIPYGHGQVIDFTNGEYALWVAPAPADTKPIPEEARLGCDETVINPLDDDTFLNIVDRVTYDEMLFGDPETQALALQRCAGQAFRRIGLPEVMGNFVDLQEDTAITAFLRRELERPVLHDKQGTNLFHRRMAKAARLFREKYEKNPEERRDVKDALDVALGSWIQRADAAKELVDKALG